MAARTYPWLSRGTSGVTSGEKCLTVDPVMSGTSVGHSLHVFTSLTPRVRDRVTALHQVFRRNVSVVSKMQKVENRGKWRKGTVATGHVLKHDSSVFATKKDRSCDAKT